MAIFAKRRAGERRTTLADSMKGIGPAKIRTPIGWWALGCVLLWLTGMATASAGPCCQGKSEASPAKGQGACCCGDAGSLPSEPLNVATVVTTQGPQDPLPTTETAKIFSHVRASEPVPLNDERSGDALIPAELRLGSALWSHAPPTRAA